jgi:hypothetical protein
VVYGVAWWAGSIALGVLYDRARGAAEAFATISLIAGAIVVAWSARARR